MVGAKLNADAVAVGGTGSTGAGSDGVGETGGIAALFVVGVGVKGSCEFRGDGAKATGCGPNVKLNAGAVLDEVGNEGGIAGLFGDAMP
jgi:hypothetical protein